MWQAKGELTFFKLLILEIFKHKIGQYVIMNYDIMNSQVPITSL